MSKAFTLTSIIPRITSITKTEVRSNSGVKLKRANGRVLTITRSNARSNASAKPAVKRSRIFSSNWVGSFSTVGLVAVVAGLAFYVYGVNASASYGYELKRQQSVVQELTETQKQLVIQQAASGSIVRVNDVASTAGMVPVTSEEFLVANQISKR